MKRAYLILAIVGAILPYVFFTQFFSIEGVSLSGFIAPLFANGVVRGFTADLIFTSLVFWVFMFTRRSRGKGPHPLLFIILNLTIGLSCALPAYLVANEK